MRRTVLVSALVAFAAAGTSGSCQSRTAASPPRADVLQSSTNRDSLERAAIALARSGNAQDLARLGQLLRDRSFLARLDDLARAPTVHLQRVISALGERATPQVVELTQTLAEDTVFASGPGDRKSFVLELLGAVKPMTEQTAAVFERSNEDGYFAFNCRLLAENGSAAALGLFEKMMLGQSEPAESRVQCLHLAIVPRRAQPEILRLADQILSRTSEREIAAGVIESVFDFQQDWFKVESGISKPADWPSVPVEARRAALALADKALARRDVGARLRSTVSSARQSIARSL